MSVPKLSAIPKLTGKNNFLLWRALVTMHIDPGQLHGTSEKHARHVILTTVDATISQKLVRLGTPKKMWDALHDAFAEVADRIDQQDKFSRLHNVDPSKYETFDSFMRAFENEVQGLRQFAFALSEQDAMLVLLRKLHERCFVFSPLIQRISYETPVQGTLPELIGVLEADYDQILRTTYGWT